MELRWYWRVVRRQWRVIIATVLLVSILAGFFSVTSFLGSSFKAYASLEFYQKPPIITGTNVAVSPQEIAEKTASSTRDSAKQFTESVSYFKAIQAAMKAKGKNIDWQVIGANFGATIANTRQIDLDYTGGDAQTDKDVLIAAAAIIKTKFLPENNAATLPPSSSKNSLITTFPVEMRLLAPVDGKPTSKSSAITGWFLKTIVGLALGVALAFLWEYLDDRIHDEEDVQMWMHVPTLGIIPKHTRAA